MEGPTAVQHCSNQSLSSGRSRLESPSSGRAFKWKVAAIWSQLIAIKVMPPSVTDLNSELELSPRPRRARRGGPADDQCPGRQGRPDGVNI
jgi:hypothetical protein